ncbi:MAG: 50S ribosomal protein L9 [Anaerolineales bacterium]|jgi:large subunit ribosomal protein L9
MKVLLIQDVYNLGRAGEVKKVANGYGRNYLIPQGLAVLATPGALKGVERIRSQAERQRAVLNKEMGAIAEKLVGVELVFPVKAGDTGKLYGSVTPQMIVDAINQQAGVELTKRHIDSQPIRTIGVHTVNVRLTMDLIPEVKAIVHREGESPESAAIEAAEIAAAEAEVLPEEVQEVLEVVEPEMADTQPEAAGESD